MSNTPEEFTEKFIQENSFNNSIYHKFNLSNSFDEIIQKQNLNFKVDKNSNNGLSDDVSHYYNTINNEKYYPENLPTPSKNINILRNNLEEFGYALIEDGLSKNQLEIVKKRTIEQASGEQKQGVALWLNSSMNGSTTQFVTTLLNKGDCFKNILEFNTDYIQSGILLEKLISECVGEDFLINSFQAIISHQYNYPQELHQDLNGSHPFQTPEAPLLVTAMFMLDDVNHHNGGTLIIPTSHKLIPNNISVLPPPINVNCKAGTIMLFDSRVLHATGVNRSPNTRKILIAGFHRSWMRTQEAWLLSASPEVLERSSQKLLKRLGFYSHTIGTIEGHGLGASGNLNDNFSKIYPFRKAIDENNYQRINEINGINYNNIIHPYTYRITESGKRSLAKAKKFNLMNINDYIKAIKLTGNINYKKRGSGNNKLKSKL
tara:strand:- start:859 stop:2154 length:1296 start_codon:yes stop_codon:yes gene_type:complete